MKCQAGIMREYKRKRADSCSPMFEGYEKLPKCGGDISGSIKAAYDSGSVCRCDAFPALELNVRCSRCGYGWWPGRAALERMVYNNEIDLADMGVL